MIPLGQKGAQPEGSAGTFQARVCVGHELDGQLGEKVEVSVTQACFRLLPPLACFLSPHLNLSLMDTFISGV